ncbi:MAG: alpha/beta fold hydrolase [Pseudomonadota bacterium]
MRDEFRDRAPWWGGDLQTLRNVFMRRKLPLPGRSSTLTFPMDDGSGDCLTGSLEMPESPAQGSPLILLIHGLTGCEDSDYMRASARFHLARGRTVLRLNLRGAGPEGHHAKSYYHAGCAPDLQAVLDNLDESLTEGGLFLIGYSLGGSVLLNWLGRYQTHHGLIGAATVSAPIEPKEACARMMEPRNGLYHHFLIERMRREVLASCKLSADEREHIATAKTILDFDDKFVAPRNGFEDAMDYYTRTAGAQFVPQIQVPTLMVHAQNDPWIPPGPYRLLLDKDLPRVEILLTKSGGHLGFHEQGMRETWHDRTIDEFIVALAENRASAMAVAS